MAEADDRAAIGRLLSRQDAGWTAGDAEAFCEALAPEVTFTNVVGKRADGRAAFVESIRAVLDGMYAGSAYRQALEAIAFVHKDVAVVDTVATLTGLREAPPGGRAPDGAMHQRPQQVMVRRPEGWEVVAFHNVIIHPRFLPAAAGDDPR